MWTVVYIAPSIREAEKLVKLLKAEGLLVKMRDIGLPPVENTNSVEILVPESEIDEAMEVINSA